MRIGRYSWVIAAEWLPQMDAAQFNGRPFTVILEAAMQRLIDSFGEPLRAEANALTNANGPTANFPFTGDDMAKFLRDGEFKYYQLVEPPFQPNSGGLIIGGDVTPQLVIHGPTPEDVIERNNASSPRNDTNRINLNFPLFLTFMQTFGGIKGSGAYTG